MFNVNCKFRATWRQKATTTTTATSCRRTNPKRNSPYLPNTHPPIQPPPHPMIFQRAPRLVVNDIVVTPMQIHVRWQKHLHSECRNVVASAACAPLPHSHLPPTALPPFSFQFDSPQNATNHNSNNSPTRSNYNNNSDDVAHTLYKHKVRFGQFDIDIENVR